MEAADRRIGVIGLGKMGGPMARRLLGAGYTLVVHDLRPEAAAALREGGAREARSPADVAGDTDVVITVLPDAAAVEQVVFGPQGLAQALGRGQALIEMTSSRPALTRRVAEALGARGVDVLDAPVSGGVRGAEEGTLCVMVGGPAPVLERCRPILLCVGRDIVHVGDRPGDGDAAKTINNFLSATAIWSVMEALVLAAKAGVEPARLLQAVNRSTGRSHTTETKVERYVLPRRFEAGFTVGQYLKDLTVCLDLADEVGVPLLVGSMVRQAWQIAAREGLADSDHTALITLLERWAGVSLGG